MGTKNTTRLARIRSYSKGTMLPTQAEPEPVIKPRQTRYGTALLRSVWSMHAFGIIIGIVLMVCFEIFVLAPFRPVVETTSFTTSFVFQNRVIPVTCHGAYMHSFDEYSLYVWGSTDIGLTGGYIRTLRIGDTLMERDEHVWGHFDKDGAHAPDVRHLVAKACGALLFTH